MSIRGSRATASELASGTPASSGGLSQQEILDLIGSADKWVQVALINGADQASVPRLLWVDPTTFYVAVNSTGDVYKSTDGGLSGANTTNISGLVTISALKKSGNYIYVAGYTTGGGVVYRSDNGGTSWTNLALSSNDYIYDLYFDDALDVYALVRISGVFKVLKYSSATWSLLATPAGVTGFSQVIGSAAAVLYVASKTSAGPAVSVSSNSGATWTTYSITDAAASRTNTLAFGLDGTTLYAGLDCANVHKSTNGGATWTLAGALPNIVSGVNRLLCDHRGYLYAGVGSSSAGRGVYRSLDDGVTWQATGDTLDCAFVDDIIEDNFCNLWAGGYSKYPATGARLYKRIA